MDNPAVYREEGITLEESARSAPWEARLWRPISWSATLVGLLAVMGAASVFALIGLAIGAHQLAPDEPANWHVLGIGALVFTVFATFFAYVIGGWIAGRIAGGDARYTSAHGAITWLISIPVLSIMMALGAGTALGSLGGLPALAPAETRGADRELQRDASQVAAQARDATNDTIVAVTGGRNPGTQPEEAAGAAARNAALSALILTLLGLAGGAIGGRMAGNRPPAFAYSAVN